MKNLFNNFNDVEIMVILSCLHFCATLTKENREQFKKEYGEKTDRELTSLMKKLLEKNS